MTGNHTYSKMMLPAPIRVWRYRLWPMTVGHYALLCRLDSSLVKKNAEFLEADLSNALWVLKQDWKKAYKNLGSFWHRRYIKKVGKKFKKKPELFLEVLQQFLIYWSWRNDTFDVWEDDTEGKNENTMPWLQSIRWMLASQWKCQPSEIENMPYKQAVNDCFGALVANGKLSIVTDEQKQRREFLSRMTESQYGN